ncbi:MAG: hypothetical protein QXK12_05390 [Candidatus Nezhaarchaeales archaeon]
MKLTRLRVELISFESMGVRSQCTYCDAGDVSVLIDAGASLGWRFGLLPHPREYEALRESRQRIAKAAEKADVVTVSHYHFDHYSPPWATMESTWTWSSKDVAAKIYGGKLVIVKDVRSHINYSQRRRGWIFQQVAGKLARQLVVGDGMTFSFKNVTLKFSIPVPHGEAETPLGYVLMLTVGKGDEKILHTSDVQGPLVHETLKLILGERPTMAIIGGPPTYLGALKASSVVVKKAVKNLAKLANTIPILIVDHHLLRDEAYLTILSDVKVKAKNSYHEVLNAAEYMGVEVKALESRRKELYEKEPPSSEFIKWTRLRGDKRRKTPPPL